MSDQIHQLIDAIREKVSRLHRQLSTERSTNAKLQEQNESLANEIISKNNEITALRSKISEIELNNKTVEKQGVIGSEAKLISNEQIDELVKEIEYCIKQLK